MNQALAQPACASPHRPRLADLIALEAWVRTAAPLAGGGRRGGMAPVPHVLAPGRGLAYAGSRAYQPGDDRRALDWRQTARHGRLFTKEFHEAHEQPLLLLADQRAPMQFGTRVRFKAVAAAHAAAALAWAAVAAGERVGGVVCRDAGWTAQRPAGGRTGGLRWLGLLAGAADAAPAGAAMATASVAVTAAAASAGPQSSGLSAALAALVRLQRPGARVVVLADQAALATVDAIGRSALGRLAQTGRLLLVPVFDPVEATPPPPGRYAVEDGNVVREMDLLSPDQRTAWAARFVRRQQAVLALARQLRAAVWPMPADASPLAILSALADAEAGRLSHALSRECSR